MFERHRTCLPLTEAGSFSVARSPSELEGTVVIPRTIARVVRIRSQRDRDTRLTEHAKELGLWIHLPDGLVQARRRDLYGCPRGSGGLDYRSVEVERSLVEAIPLLLHDVDVGENIDDTGGGQLGLDREVVLVGLPDPAPIELVGNGSLVDRPTAQPVHRADEEIPRVRGEQVHDRPDGLGEEVDFETEENGQTSLLRLQDRGDVAIERQHAIGAHEGLGLNGEVVPGFRRPELTQYRRRFSTTKEVFGESNLGHPSGGRRENVGLDVTGGIDTGLGSDALVRAVRMKMNVIVAHTVQANQPRLCEMLLCGGPLPVDGEAHRQGHGDLLLTGLDRCRLGRGEGKLIGANERCGEG